MRGLTCGPQQLLISSSARRGTNQSDVHSHTFPAMSYRPYPFGGNDPTGATPSKPSCTRFCHGNSPCQLFAIGLSGEASSSPHVNLFPSRPPRAANSPSASVGSSLPAHFAKASASSKETWTTGCCERPSSEDCGP